MLSFALNMPSNSSKYLNQPIYRSIDQGVWPIHAHQQLYQPQDTVDQAILEKMSV